MFGASIHLALIQNLPGERGFELRYRYWKKRLKYLGTHARIDCGVYLQNPAFISIDDNCWIDRGVILMGGVDTSKRKRRVVGKIPEHRGHVSIGRNVHIAPYCIVSGIEAGVTIGHDCGLAS